MDRSPPQQDFREPRDKWFELSIRSADYPGTVCSAQAERSASLARTGSSRGSGLRWKASLFVAGALIWIGISSDSAVSFIIKLLRSRGAGLQAGHVGIRADVLPLADY